MATIRIQNIGPIVDTGVLELNQFNVFIGPQSSGKSTIMKIVSFCSWMEKHLMLDKSALYNYTHHFRFLKLLKSFHKFDDSSFSEKSQMEYIGHNWKIVLKGKKNAEMSQRNKIPINYKLSYIPSERNLVFAVQNVGKAYTTRQWDNLFNYTNEWEEVVKNYPPEEKISVDYLNNVQFYFNPKSQKEIIRLESGKEITPYFASSGYQSVLPLIVMTDYLTDRVFKDRAKVNSNILSNLIRQYLDDSELEITVKDKMMVANVLNYKFSHIFIEEPEQNLFPKTQQSLIWEITRKIIACSNSQGEESKLFLTTHSPYIITAFNTLILAHEAKLKNPEVDLDKIVTGVPVAFEKVSAYFVQDDGHVISIKDDELKMIAGELLDSASDVVDEADEKLRDIIYG